MFNALTSCNAMWLRLGRKFEQHAHRLAASEGRLDRAAALDAAAAAEGCYWRATGDADAIDLRKRTP